MKRITSSQKALKTAVIDKLGISPRTLDRRITAKISIEPVTRTQALWIVAKESDLIMSKYLTSNELRQLREISRTASEIVIKNTALGVHKQSKTTRRRKKSLFVSIVNAVEVNSLYRILVIASVVIALTSALIFFL